MIASFLAILSIFILIVCKFSSQDFQNIFIILRSILVLVSTYVAWLLCSHVWVLIFLSCHGQHSLSSLVYMREYVTGTTITHVLVKLPQEQISSWVLDSVLRIVNTTLVNLIWYLLSMPICLLSFDWFTKLLEELFYLFIFHNSDIFLYSYINPVCIHTYIYLYFPHKLHIYFNKM